MMEQVIYQVDAFSAELFKGNPAAVCPLSTWLPDETMQAIAMENNLSETAFFVQEENGWRIRWFTPTAEVKLCGHATLAAAFVYFREINPSAEEITFNSLSGPLNVNRSGEWLTLDFPLQAVSPIDAPAALEQALNVKPLAVYAADDWLVLLDSEAAVRALQPDLILLKKLERRGVIVTAVGEDCDFVSRFFAPKYGIDEDPVTGSAYTQLAPFWGERLKRQKFHARQLSARGGELYCEIKAERVFISGQAVAYMKGTMTLPPTALVAE